MKRAVLLSSRAQAEFGSLDRKTQGRIRIALTRFATEGRGDLKKLRGVSGETDLFRLRVGEYRVVFALFPEEIRVTRIVARSAGYDWL